VIGVERANGLAGRIASKLEKVRLVRSKAATVSFKDGELLLGVNPDEGYGGRPSSDVDERSGQPPQRMRKSSSRMSSVARSSMMAASMAPIRA